MHLPRKSNTRFLLVSGVCLLVHCLLLVWVALRDSPVDMEVRYVASGLFLIETGSGTDFPQNPPLPKLFLAAPAYPTFRRVVGTALPRANGTERAPSSVLEEVTRYLGPSTITVVHRARLASVVASVASGWLIVSCFALLGNPKAGQWAAFLWCFSPLTLWLGHMATADIFAALGVVLVILAVAFYARQPNLRRAFVLGSAVSLAASLKFTAILLLPLCLAVVLLYPWSSRAVLRPTMRAASFGLGSLLTLYPAFLFSPPLGVAFPGWWPHSRLLRAALQLPGSYSLLKLLPFDFVTGVDWQARAFELLPQRTWFLGTLREGPVYMYYPVALLVKTPAALIVLAAIGLFASVATLRGRRDGATQQDRLLAGFCLLGSFVVLSVLCWKSTVCEARYLSAVLPLLYVASAIGIATLHARWCRVFTALLAAAAAVEVAAASPHYLAFGNVLVGGPRGSWWYVSSRDVDRGQNLYRVRRWVDRHLSSHPVAIVYSPLELAFFGLSDAVRPTSTPQAVLVSVAFVTGERSYRPKHPQPRAFSEWFQHLRTVPPLAQPVPGVFLYEFSPLTSHEVPRPTSDR